jgi:hypothetical protein
VFHALLDRYETVDREISDRSEGGIDLIYYLITTLSSHKNIDQGHFAHFNSMCGYGGNGAVAAIPVA